MRKLCNSKHMMCRCACQCACLRSGQFVDLHMFPLPAVIPGPRTQTRKLMSTPCVSHQMSRQDLGTKSVPRRLVQKHWQKQQLQRLVEVTSTEPQLVAYSTITSDVDSNREEDKHGHTVDHKFEAENLYLLAVDNNLGENVTNVKELDKVITDSFKCSPEHNEVLNIPGETISVRELDKVISDKFKCSTEDLERELEDMKDMLICTDEEMIELVTRFPRLRDLEVLKFVKDNISVLLETSTSVLETRALKSLLSSQGCLLQIEPSELKCLLEELTQELRKKYKSSTFRYGGYMKPIRTHVEKGLKGEDMDNVKFLSQLLNINYEVTVKITSGFVLGLIRNKFTAVSLKEKVDFLLSEGITSEDIACNLYLLTMKMKFLDATIAEMKATIGEVSLQILKSKYKEKSNRRYRSSVSKIPILLDCSRKDFSALQRKYLNSVRTSNAIKVIEYLMKIGVYKDEIVKNPYILGYSLETVQKALEANIESCDTCTETGQRKLLNLTVYHLEFEK